MILTSDLFAEQHHLGDVYGSNAGFKLPNGHVRSPDVSFVRADRLPNDRAPEEFAEFLPDLANISPMVYKWSGWLSLGTRPLRYTAP